MDTSIAVLDREGSRRLTLRGLATKLNSGVASLYWYTTGKDDLMALVTSEVLGRALGQFHALCRDGEPGPEEFEAFPAPRADPRTSAATAQALEELRCLCLCLFSQMREHPWLAGQLLSTTRSEENALRTWECTGQLLQRMELDAEQRFYASLAVANYAFGTGAGIAHRHNRPAAEESARQVHEKLERAGRSGPGMLPVVRAMLDSFGEHDDRSEYIAGLELLLAGIERQTWGGSSTP
ncbi:TetR family transcriptional regulator [Kocuria sp. ICS0012]|nr:TetR family transcriptional regulator [Kocuria sp. ICS0012]